jgi:glycosyltransferase involved in cell wall biosynthesis
MFNWYLARALAAQGHDVRVIAAVHWTDAWRSRQSRRALRACRSEVREGLPVRYATYYYPPKVLRNQYGWCMWRSVRRAVFASLDEGRPDVVLGYWAHPDGEAVVRAAEAAKAASAIIVGGSDVLLLTRDTGRRRRVARVLCAADAIFTVSQHLRAKVIDLGVEARKVHVWEQGVDRAKFHPGSRTVARRRLHIATDGHALVWVGRMVSVKALDVLLNACRILHTRALRCHLYLVGDGPLRTSLEARVTTLGLQRYVHFVGSQAHDRLPDWYRAADVTVLSSHSEGLPNVLRESLACGTRFVATDVGGIREIAGPRDRLVPPGDAEALAREIRQSLSDTSAVEPRRLPDWSDSAAAMSSILRRLRVRSEESQHAALAAMEAVS